MAENQQSSPEYAGFWPRLAAWIIDGLIVSVVCAALIPVISFGLLLPWYWWVNSFSNEPDVVPFWFIGTGVLLWILAWGAYCVAFWVRRGQTPGKMAMGIKVITAEGSGLTAETALLRYLGYLVCVVLLSIPFLEIIFAADKRAIPDKFARTVVIQLPRKN